MRKSIAFFGGALFVVLSLSIYLVVDQMSRMPSYESIIESQVNRKVIEPLLKIEQDMDRLEDKIKISKNAVNQLKIDSNIIDKKPDGNSLQGTSETLTITKDVKGKTGASMFNSMMLVGNKYDDGCTFSQQPSGLSSDVKMLDVYDLIPFDNPDGGVWKQGWQVQRDKNEEHLDVFVVPHSHNDPGWIKTVDAYYMAQTRHILDNVVDALAVDKRRKFIWAEISYLSMWWGDADERRKNLFRQQVASNQLEIVTGGWVMNDEANTHYFAIIDQMIEGHQWLEANIGVRPRAGWAIDPFGHSPTMAYILKRTGFDSMLIQRTHYSVKKYLARRKKLEFAWRQNWDHSSSTDMFCHMMPFYSYDVPHTCGPEPAVCCQFDFRRLMGDVSCPWRIEPVKINDDNIQERADKLLDQYRKKATLYKNNVVLVPLGDDFRYDVKFETTEQFTNYQKLFDYMNSKPELKVTAQFGTLSDYFDKIWKKTGVKAGTKPSDYPTLSGDFYTYADRDDHYWSGYYTSRPFYKNMDRVLESRLRAAEIIFYLAYSHARKNAVNSFPSTNLYHLLMQGRRNLALFQHHDGITGTSKDHVVMDYGTRLLRSLQDTSRIIEDSSYFLLHETKADFKPSDGLLSMVQFDEERKGQDAFPSRKILEVTQGSPRKVTLYNPLSEHRTQVVSVFVSTSKLKVTDPAGNTVQFQVSPVFDDNFNPVPDQFRVHFVATITPLGLSTYTFQTDDSLSSKASAVTLYHYIGDVVIDKSFAVDRKDWSKGQITLENSELQVVFDSKEGTMTKITSVKNGKTMDLMLGFVSYGTTQGRDQSGAYLFLPDGPARPYTTSNRVKMIVLKGDLFHEITVGLPVVKHTVRLYNIPGPEGMMLDIENTVDIRGEHNKELAMRFATNIQNNNEFFTDLNGFQMQLRQTLTKLPLQANFYPMPNSAVIQDHKTRFTLHSAQANGVASLQSGNLEVILDRRLAQDDNRGVGQGVMDNKRTPANFRLFVERFMQQREQTTEDLPLTYHSLSSIALSQHLSHPISVLHHSTSITPSLVPNFSGLTQALPCDILLVNLRTIQKGVEPEPSSQAAMIVRRHGYDCSFPSECKTSLGKVPLSNTFKDLKIGNIQATSLTMMYDGKTIDTDSILQLEPMEIYTYKLKLE